MKKKHKAKRSLRDPDVATLPRDLKTLPKVEILSHPHFNFNFVIIIIMIFTLGVVFGRV